MMRAQCKMSNAKCRIQNRNVFFIDHFTFWVLLWKDV
jgi:hypothetical protein